MKFDIESYFSLVHLLRRKFYCFGLFTRIRICCLDEKHRFMHLMRFLSVSTIASGEDHKLLYQMAGILSRVHMQRLNW